MSDIKVLAVIAARGGSKGLPQKNILPVVDKPLIAYSIEAALKSSLLDRTIVSTDDDEIAEVAKRFGAEIPFLRPSQLAEDDSLAQPVIAHAAQWLEEHEGYLPDYLMLLQPTSPLRTANDIDNAITIALENDADGVVGLCHTKHHPYWTKQVAEDGQISNFVPLDQAYDRRQTLPPAYAVNGAMYLVKRQVLLEQETFYTDKTYAYIMPVERSLDVDTTWDLHIAELILRDDATDDAD